MSDDRELVELLAAIDATPRASWVAGLRADLDAAWEIEDAGYLDSLRTTTVTLVDHEPTQPTRGHRWPILIAAAAAVVLVGLLVVYDGDDVTPADEPSPTVTAPRTPLPRALPSTPPDDRSYVPGSYGERYVPGSYFVDETPTARIYFTIGAGWRDLSPGPEILQGDIGGFAFGRADRVFSDACHWSDGYYPGSVATFDGLVAALSRQGGWVDVTAPSDISVDGYAGKAFQRTAPADLSDCSTTPPNFSPLGERRNNPQIPVLRSWQNDSRQYPPSGGEFYEPGEVETVWVLDIDGTVVVINTRLWPSVTTGARLSAEARALAGPTATAHAESAAVLDSIRIERT